MVCQKCGDIELEVTPGRRAEMNSGKSTCACRRKNHCIEHIDVLLCRRHTNITKEDMDIIMNAFKDKKTFTIHSRHSIKNTLQLLKMKKCFGKIEYLY